MKENSIEEDIKILEEYLDKNDRNFISKNKYKLLQAIENLIKAYKQKDKGNNNLRRLYRITVEKLRENGKEELADYFLAQINEVPTFSVDNYIDYYTEYYKLKEEIENKRKEYQETYKDVREELKELKQENAELKVKIINIRHKTIPVSLVEEKIEELEDAKKFIDKENWKYIYQMQINILQELLEKRK